MAADYENVTIEDDDNVEEAVVSPENVKEVGQDLRWSVIGRFWTAHEEKVAEM